MMCVENISIMFRFIFRYYFFDPAIKEWILIPFCNQNGTKDGISCSGGFRTRPVIVLRIKKKRFDNDPILKVI